MSKISANSASKRPKVIFSEEDEQQLVKDSFLGQCRDRLYVPKSTYKCYKKGCVCCAYKMIVRRPNTTCNGNKCPPNQRPEMCLRIQDLKQKNVDRNNRDKVTTPSTDCYGIYRNQPGIRILTIGDGDLSFTLNLAQFIPKCRVIGTTYLTKAEFKNVYSDSERTLRAASMLSNLRILHGVDATLLGKKNSPLYNMSEDLYHKIIWHFPCVSPQNNFAVINSSEAKRDGQNEEMDKNKQLLLQFFSRCHRVGVPGGEIHILHKTKAAYAHWGIIDLAESSGLIFRACVAFDKSLYHGYRNRKARSGKGSFPCHDARVFIFTLPLVRKLASPQRAALNPLDFLTPLDDTSKFKKCSVETLKSVTKGLLRGRLTNYYARQTLPGRPVRNNGDSSTRLGKRNRSSYSNNSRNIRKKII